MINKSVTGADGVVLIPALGMAGNFWYDAEICGFEMHAKQQQLRVAEMHVLGLKTKQKGIRCRIPDYPDIVFLCKVDKLL